MRSFADVLERVTPCVGKGLVFFFFVQRKEFFFFLGPKTGKLGGILQIPTGFYISNTYRYNISYILLYTVCVIWMEF